MANSKIDFRRAQLAGYLLWDIATALIMWLLAVSMVVLVVIGQGRLSLLDCGVASLLIVGSVYGGYTATRRVPQRLRQFSAGVNTTAGGNDGG